MNISKFGTTDSQSSSPIRLTGIENKVSKTGDIMHGDLNLNNHKITNLAAPEAEADCVNKGFLKNFIRFESGRVVGSTLATVGTNSNGEQIASASPINIKGSNMFGLQTIIRRPNNVFKIKNHSDNNTYLELGNRLILKGLAYPREPTDAATKQFVENEMQNLATNVNLRSTASLAALQYIQTEDSNVTVLRNLDLKNHSIFNVGMPTEPTSAITKQYFEQNSYKPKFQILLGASFSSGSSNVVHSVDTNQRHYLYLRSGSRNDFLSVQSDNFRLRDEVDNTYMEISVSGLIRNADDPFEKLMNYVYKYYKLDNKKMVLQKYVQYLKMSISEIRS